MNDEPGITQALIARRLHIRPQSITRPVNSLIDAGHIITEKTPKRGSPTGLHITRQGAQMLDAAWAAARGLTRADTLSISHREAADLVHLLDRLRTRLQDPEH